MTAIPVGKPLIHPAVDVLLVAGGGSLVIIALVASGYLPSLPGGANGWPMLVLGVNLAHFASSTVRLYSKRGATRDWPFVTLALPLVTMAVLLLALLFAEQVGSHLINLYLTWSAYHYAAQTYGIAMIYLYRSGTVPAEADRGLLRAACLLPFLYLFFRGPSAGVEWLVPASVLEAPLVAPVRSALVQALRFGALAAPALVFVHLRWRARPLPLLSVLAMTANATWWTHGVETALFWVPLFHGMQYLPIVTAFHVKERLREPGNTRGWLYHAATFYAASVAFAYVLFSAWPSAFLAVGFGLPESVLLVLATINIHHFIVDAYIWRLRRDPSYRPITTPGLPPMGQPALA